MADEWFYRTPDDQPCGPLRPGELLELVRRGQIQEQTLIRKGDSAWFPAKTVGGLFAAAAKPRVKMCCPECQHEIKLFPAACRHCGFFVQQPAWVRLDPAALAAGPAAAEGRLQDVGQRLGGLVRRLVPRNPK